MITTTETKRCNTCHQELPLALFHSRQARCIVCRSAARRAEWASGAEDRKRAAEQRRVARLARLSFPTPTRPSDLKLMRE